MAFLHYYRRKLLTESEPACPHNHDDDVMEPIPGLPYNFPREALLREPPPRYTSQQDVNGTLYHVNPGYNDDEIYRAPPCYSSNSDLSGGLPIMGVIEPPPCYSSRQDLSPNINDPNIQGYADINGGLVSVFSVTTGDSGSKQELTPQDSDNNKDVTQDVKETNVDKESDNEWLGPGWKGVPKALKVQNHVSSSCDSDLDQILHNPYISSNPDGGQPARDGGDAITDTPCGSFSQNHMSTISVQVEQRSTGQDAEQTNEASKITNSPTTPHGNRKIEDVHASSTNGQGNRPGADTCVQSRDLNLGCTPHVTRHNRANSLPLLESLSSLSVRSINIDNDTQVFYC